MSAFKRKLVPLICIAFVAASVATAIFYGLLGSRLRQASGETPRQSIVVAARSVERGAIVTAADVKLSTWGGQYPLKGGYSAIEQVTGKAVYSALQENEPVTQARLVSGDASGGIGIAPGMRAISVHASDSSGVLALLHPGYKVDVQVVAAGRSGELKLRTTLENVEVLTVPSAEPNGGRSAAPVITLLATPEAADRLALADSGARVRLLLRNPFDESLEARPVLGLANVLGDGNPPPRGITGRTHGAHVSWTRPAANRRDARNGTGQVRLLVRVASAQQQALAQLAAQASIPRWASVLQVIALSTGQAPVQLLKALEESHQIEVLSSTELAAGNRRRVGMEAGAVRGGCRLRIQFVPWLEGRKMLLRVQPEIVAPTSSRIPARRMETEVELVDGQTFLIVGLSSADNWPTLAERLFALAPKSVGNREPVVMVTTRIVEHAGTTALAGRR